MAQLIVGGNATAANVLAGTTFSAGPLYNAAGAMINRGAVAITPSAAAQTIPQGYHNGSGAVAAVPVPADKVLTGTTIAGTAGSMPNRSAENFHNPALEAATWQGDRVFLRPPNGFFDGTTWVTYPAPDLVQANVRKGKNVLGVIGEYKRPYTGQSQMLHNWTTGSAFYQVGGNVIASEDGNWWHVSPSFNNVRIRKLDAAGNVLSENTVAYGAAISNYISSPFAVVYTDGFIVVGTYAYDSSDDQYGACLKYDWNGTLLAAYPSVMINQYNQFASYNPTYNILSYVPAGSSGTATNVHHRDAATGTLLNTSIMPTSGSYCVAVEWVSPTQCLIAAYRDVSIVTYNGSTWGSVNLVTGAASSVSAVGSIAPILGRLLRSLNASAF